MSLVGAVVSLLRGSQFYYDTPDGTGSPRPARPPARRRRTAPSPRRPTDRPRARLPTAGPPTAGPPTGTAASRPRALTLRRTPDIGFRRATLRVPLPGVRRHLRGEPPDGAGVRPLHLPPGARRHREAAVHRVGRRKGVGRRERRARPVRRRLLRRRLRLRRLTRRRSRPPGGSRTATSPDPPEGSPICHDQHRPMV